MPIVVVCYAFDYAPIHRRYDYGLTICFFDFQFIISGESNRDRERIRSAREKCDECYCVNEGFVSRIIWNRRYATQNAIHLIIITNALDYLPTFSLRKEAFRIHRKRVICFCREFKSQNEAKNTGYPSAAHNSVVCECVNQIWSVQRGIPIVAIHSTRYKPPLAATPLSGWNGIAEQGDEKKYHLLTNADEVG